ncbi:MAG TPA: TraR/DksA C4-type zinc finger protein [bacterium]|nr:TraR/DksA C4-type zinc finger protein [bacterium]
MPQKRSSKSTSGRNNRGGRSRTQTVRKAAARPGSDTAPRRAKGGGIGPLETYARLLLEERQRLRQELSEMEQHQVKAREEKPVADVSGGYDEDLVDVASEAFEREKGLALESSVQGLLAMVEEALRRIRTGSYGICTACGQLIDANRLRAIPYTRLCIKCKEREERLRSAAR